MSDSEGRRIAKARDAWMDSENGAKCAHGSASGQYLRNRLESAFIAGWHAAKKDEES